MRAEEAEALGEAKNTAIALARTSSGNTSLTVRYPASLEWNLDQGSRSIRAGIRLRIPGLLVVRNTIVCLPSNPRALPVDSGSNQNGSY